jgi:hypothetical protein
MRRFDQLGERWAPDEFKPRPGMLRVTAMILFRNESLMLDFGGTIRVEDGAVSASYSYDPQVAITLRGTVSPSDISRLLSSITGFPGITHASAELETVLSFPDGDDSDNARLA